MRIPFLVMVSLLLVLSFLSWSLSQPHTLIDSNSLEIVSSGHLLTVSDRLSGQEYQFKRVHIRRSDALTAPYTAIESGTIRIDIVPGGCLKIESDGSVYLITPKMWRFEQWLKKLQMNNY